MCCCDLLLTAQYLLHNTKLIWRTDFIYPFALCFNYISAVDFASWIRLLHDLKRALLSWDKLGDLRNFVVGEKKEKKGEERAVDQQILP